ncbi:hypothetical protein [Roseibium sp.]|uniref:hypothetical protein n=1 Tax=Roseibium sp. TaxID=1936156 RepID=UPI003266B37F
MAKSSAYQSAREAVGLFHSAEELQAAVDALLTHGFDRADLSVLASEDAIGKAFGDSHIPVRDLEDRPDVPTMSYVPKETIGDAEGAVLGAFIYVPALAGAAMVVASGGALAAAIAAAAIAGGVGASLGAIAALVIGETYALQIEEHISDGGLLLWVRARDAAHEERAVAIFKENGAADAHVHDLPSLS